VQTGTRVVTLRVQRYVTGASSVLDGHPSRCPSEMRVRPATRGDTADDEDEDDGDDDDDGGGSGGGPSPPANGEPKP